jgi:NADPH:quinone reductase-like Zn-dependent oxidoreductase
MRCLQFTAVNRIAFVEAPDPVADPGEAIVAIRAAALNHRDVWIKSGQYAGLKYPCIAGSDGAGVVAAVGPGADASWVGREVVINPALDWGDDEAAQGSGFSILGMPRHGTMAERVAVPAAQLAVRPAHLTWEESAALPLAGLTAYRALFTRAGLKPSDRILVTGIGGGVAALALQFAVAHGAEVWVTSSSTAKIDRALALGAKGGFDYRTPGWAAEAARQAGGFDVILDSSGGAGFETLIEAAAGGGRIVFIGATAGNPPGLPLRKVFWRQISLLGSTMGSPRDWEAMLAFAALHRIRPVVSAVFPLERAAEGFAEMERGAQFGKLVFTPGGGAR